MGYYKFFLAGGFAVNGLIDVAYSDLLKELDEARKENPMPDSDFLKVKNACTISITTNPKDPNRGLVAVKPIGPVEDPLPILKCAIVTFHPLEEATGQVIEQDFVKRRSGIEIPAGATKSVIRGQLKTRGGKG